MRRLIALVFVLSIPVAAFAQSTGSVVLWDRLVSAEEVQQSEVGPDGVIRVGSALIEYVPVRFGSGIRVSGSGSSQSRVRFALGAIPGFSGNAGTVAFWVRPSHDSSYGDIARWITFDGSDGHFFPNVNWLWGQMNFQLCALPFWCQYGRGDLRVPPSRFSFAAGDVFHVAFVWDRNGIDGTLDTLRAYINGTLYAARAETWSPDLRVSTLQLGAGDYPQHAAVDNLVIYDYAKTDFSDRFDESPLPHTIAALKLYQTLLSGCIKTKGTVRLAEPAPAGGLSVALRSDNLNVTVPASIVVSEGALAKRFQNVTSPVAAREAGTITASVPGQELSATLTLKPMVLKDLTLTPNQGGGRRADGHCA